MMNVTHILSAVVMAGMVCVGNVGCAEKPPTKNEIKVTTASGTTVTIEKPVKKDSQNPPSAKP